MSQSCHEVVLQVRTIGSDILRRAKHQVTNEKFSPPSTWDSMVARSHVEFRTSNSDFISSKVTAAQRIDVNHMMRVAAWCCLMAALTAWPPASVRAIISDVDGTLMAFATNSQLSRRNQAALSRAKEAGCVVSVATGRIPGPWYRSLCSQLPKLGPGVFCNGALVMEGQGGNGGPVYAMCFVIFNVFQTVMNRS